MPPASPAAGKPHHTFDALQMMDLDVGVVIGLGLIDVMESGFDTLTLGMGFVISLLVSCAYSVFCFTVQKETYGDSRSLAFGKACFCWCILLLPTPLPALAAVPSAILNVIAKSRKK
jgi:hypothetical protein